MEIIDSKTKREKEIQELGESFKHDVEEILANNDLTGYAIVAWDSEYGAYSSWDVTFSTMPASVVPEFVKQALRSHFTRVSTNNLIDDRLL